MEACVYFILQAFARTRYGVGGELLSALAQRRRGAFAEFGAVAAGHAAEMGEAEIEGDVDHPLARPGARKPRVQLFEADILKHARYRAAKMTFEAQLQGPDSMPACRASFSRSTVSPPCPS